MKISLFIFIIIYLLLIPLQAREITDMYGNKLTVPDKITRVYPGSPPVMCMIYAVDPDLLVGANLNITEEAKPYLKKNILNLPKIGNSPGHGPGGPNMNIEAVLKVKPDIIITWTYKDQPVGNSADKIFSRMNIPVVNTAMDKLSAYGDTFIFYGKLLNREKRAAALTDYTGRILSETRKFLTSIPVNKRPAVYYAESADGLNTECHDSIHSEMIPMAGGKNIMKCFAKGLTGNVRSGMEEIIVSNPDIILAFDKAFFQKVYSDVKWENIKAVKNKRVYLIPKIPFNWFDRPPCFMRILGLQWILGCFYPESYKKDLVKETQHFFKLFLNVKISKDEAKKILSQPEIK